MHTDTKKQTSLFSRRIFQIRSGAFATHLKWLVLKHIVYRFVNVRRLNARATQARLAKWRKQIDGKDSIDFPIEKDIVMRLWGDSLIAEHIYSGTFELEERELISGFLKAGDIFVDVGANIGLFTLLSSRAVGAHGKVYAFEPTRKTYERLVENVNLNSLTNVTCHQIALSNETGTAKFNVSLDGYDGWNSLAPPSEGEHFDTEEVQTVQWDQFAQEQNLVGHVALMKIDVEGWETQLLKGCITTFAREDAPVLLIEFTEENARSAGTSCQELYAAITQLGYGLYTWDLQKGTFDKAPLLDYYPYSNYLAIKDLGSVAERLSTYAATGNV